MGHWHLGAGHADGDFQNLSGFWRLLDCAIGVGSCDAIRVMPLKFAAADFGYGARPSGGDQVFRSGYADNFAKCFE